MNILLDGLVAAIQCSDGKYIGGQREKEQKLELVSDAKQWERWAFVYHGDTWSIRQEVSGLFLGGYKENGEQPALVEKDDAWERFVVEQKGSNSVAFRNIDGNYLCRDKKKVKWTNSPNENSLWKIIPTKEQPPLKHFEGLPKHGDVVTLCSVTQGFVGGTRYDEQDIVLVPEPQEWEDLVFEITHDRVSFKQVVSGLYLGRNVDAGTPVKWVPKKGDYEMFHILNLGGGVVAFRNSKGNFLSKQDKRMAFSVGFDKGQHWKIMPPSATINPPKPPTTQVTNSNPVHQSAVKPPMFHRTVSLQHFEGLPSNGDVVTLKSAAGGYIGAAKDEGSDILLTEAAAAWEDLVFEIFQEKVALKQVVSNLYVGKNSDVNQPAQWAKELNISELFTIANLGSGVIALKNHKGNYLSNRDGRLSFNNTLANHEQWKFMPSHELLRKGITDLGSNSGVVKPSTWSQIKMSRGQQWNSQQHQGINPWSQHGNNNRPWGGNS